ncbi:MAG TPA: rhomboid family intramembrane serine protease [Nitrolancea sp.]|nr:rhomboid family intramembrane serine protease [Nitrolancea sp.]
MLPFADDPQVRSPRFPIVTILLILINVVVFAYEVSLGDAGVNRFVNRWGFTPAEFWNGQHPITIITAMFLHGGLLHIAGNMLFLWIFGDNVEDQLGHITYLVFYLLGGIFASLAFAVVFAGSHDPLVGASGAIAAVLGGYILLYPRSIVRTLLIFGPFLAVGGVAAFILIGIWFALQVVYSLSSISVISTQAETNVAFFAHVAGFLYGLVVTWVIRERRRQEVVHWDHRPWWNRAFRNWLLLILLLSVLGLAGREAVDAGTISSTAFRLGLSVLVVVIAVIDGLERLKGRTGLLGSGAQSSRFLAIVQIVAAFSTAAALMSV